MPPTLPKVPPSAAPGSSTGGKQLLALAQAEDAWEASGAEIEVTAADVDDEAMHLPTRLAELCELCRIGSLEERDEAAEGLKEVATGPLGEYQNLMEVCPEGLLLEALLAVLRGGSDRARVNAAICLRCLGRLEDNKKAMVQSGGLLEGLVTMARLDGMQASTQAVAALANLATTPFTREVIGTTEGALRVVASVLRHGEAEGRRYAAGALGNLAWQNSSNCQQIGIIPSVFASLRELLLSSDEAACVAASSALANLATEQSNHPAMSEKATLEALVGHLLAGFPKKAQAHCLDAIAELARYSGEDGQGLGDIDGLFPGLVKLSQRSEKDGTCAAVSYAFAAFASQPTLRLQMVRSTGLMEALMTLATHDEVQTRSDAVCAISELSQEESALPRIAATAGLLEELQKVAMSEQGDIREVAIATVARLGYLNSLGKGPVKVGAEMPSAEIEVSAGFSL